MPSSLRRALGGAICGVSGSAICGVFLTPLPQRGIWRGSRSAPRPCGLRASQNWRRARRWPVLGRQPPRVAQRPGARDDEAESGAMESAEASSVTPGLGRGRQGGAY